MNMIELQGVEFSYPHNKKEAEGKKALDQITLSIKKGEFVALLGRNGSGKSTLARLLNALSSPAQGTVMIHGLDTRDASQVWNVRRMTGMVFPDPDNQIIGTTVEEDVAFGPENLSLPPTEIMRRVQEALQAVGLTELAGSAPHLLSGGEKQRLALAGVLAMQPECIVLDEATSLLDPIGREEVLTLVRRLNREKGITVVHITHHMEEVGFADRILVLDNGKVVLDGAPREIFVDGARIKELGLDLPAVTELFALLNQDGFDLPPGILTCTEALTALGKSFFGKGHDLD